MYNSIKHWNSPQVEALSLFHTLFLLEAEIHFFGYLDESYDKGIIVPSEG